MTVLGGYRLLMLAICLLAIPSAYAFAQHTTLVYEPDVEVDAVGAVRYLEERVDGKLTKRADFIAPGICVEFMQRRNADSSLRRLSWFYEGDPESGDYLIEEQNCQPDGTWSTTGLLNYSEGKLVRVRFFSGENLIEERLYEYDGDGVVQEITSRPSEKNPTVFTFRRPETGTVEAFMRQPDGADIIVARLGYDKQGRLVLEERFEKGKLKNRDVFMYNPAGKLIDHIRYDDRNIVVRHVMYGYTENGLPKSVVHLDEKEHVVLGVSYTREYDGENVKSVIRNSTGEVTGTIEYARENGNDVSRIETFVLGDGELKIHYTDVDTRGNWLKKETSTYNAGRLKSRSVTTRIIRYFE